MPTNQKRSYCHMWKVDVEAGKFFTETKLLPSFSYIDPFGYKGLSLKIVKSAIKGWGCD
ncbi:MAG: hypothetical protein OXI87_12605 [Albidovulum sp.]|nr:hypothetical protein [Albidovulum sp.]